MKQDIIGKIVREINMVIVMHPHFERAYQGILELIHVGSLAGVPFGAVVVAPPGCGKTALAECIQRAIPSNQLLQDDIRSVYVKAEANATVGHFVSKLLKQLGYPVTIRASTVYEQSSLVYSALRERGVKVVFFDEAQHICRGRRTISASAITDWIKQLADEAGVVVVLSGTRELLPLVEINDQLASRLPAHFELKEFDRNEEWVGLLKKIAETVKGIDLSCIHAKFHKTLHAVTRGTPRTLKQLLIASASAAVKQGKTAVDQESLAEGHKALFGENHANPNPFLFA